MQTRVDKRGFSLVVPGTMDAELPRSLPSGEGVSQ